MTSSAFRRIMRRHLPALACLVLALAIGGALAVSQSAASAADVNHRNIVPEMPRRDTPIVVDGTVYAQVHVGDRIIVAGQFSKVQTYRDGPIVVRRNIFAYNINTGAIIDDFTPKVNGTIFDLVADENDLSLFIGGRFTQVDDQNRGRLAKLDYQGNLDPTFRPSANSMVLAMEISGDTLYVGGVFNRINGHDNDRIGAVSTYSGAVDFDFDFAISGNIGAAGSRAVKALDVSNDGTRLLVGFNGVSIIDGNDTAHPRYGVGMIHLPSNTITAYRTKWFQNSYPRCTNSVLQIRDIEFSPDDSMIVVVEQGGSICDKVVALPGGNNGVNNPLWVTAAHDSVFSVGITNNAVYIGGHFCFLRAHGSVSSTQALTYPWELKPEACQIGSGNSDIGVYSARQQLAALNPNTGQPLAWNPKSNAFVAVYDIEPINRGLLIGQDMNRINDIVTGRHAFFDFGGITPAPNVPTYDPFSCTATAVGDNITLDWTAQPGATNYEVHRNGSKRAVLSGTTFADNNLATGSYSHSVRYTANGKVTAVVCNPRPISIGGQTLTCNRNGTTLTWNSLIGVSEYQVRKNNAWIASTTSASYSSATGSLSDTYAIRYRTNGQTITVDCS